MMGHTTENFRASDYDNAAIAKQLRDRRARHLRREGHTVICQTWDFTDLARDVLYQLHILHPPGTQT